MKQFTISDRRFVAVEVPAGSTDFRVIDDRIVFVLPPDYSGDVIKGYLPFGQWNLIGLVKDISEETCKGIVPWFELAGKTGYKDFAFNDPRFPFSSARESGYSLIKSLSLDPDTTVLLEKIK